MVFGYFCLVRGGWNGIRRDELVLKFVIHSIAVACGGWKQRGPALTQLSQLAILSGKNQQQEEIRQQLSFIHLTEICPNCSFVWDPSHSLFFLAILPVRTYVAMGFLWQGVSTINQHITTSHICACVTGKVQIQRLDLLDITLSS